MRRKSARAGLFLLIRPFSEIPGIGGTRIFLSPLLENKVSQLLVYEEGNRRIVTSGGQDFLCFG